MLRIGHGLNHREAEPYVSLAEDALEHINRCGEAGAFLVEQLPICMCNDSNSVGSSLRG